MTGRSLRARPDRRAEAPGPRASQERTRPGRGTRQTGARFFFLFLYRELRRRLRQALLIAAGLGLGVGLVMTVSAASAGVSNAQAAVLRSLYGIGADLIVT
jgi:putative ABC transport system permease protein